MHGFLFINKRLLISYDTGIYAIILFGKDVLSDTFLEEEKRQYAHTQIKGDNLNNLYCAFQIEI